MEKPGLHHFGFFSLILAGILSVLSCKLIGDRGKQVEPYNILMIAVDDMNDWVGCLEGYPGIQTPNIEKLARNAAALPVLKPLVPKKSNERMGSRARFSLK